MSKSATPAGTARYAKRFSGTAAPAHFREAQKLNASSLGIGTYLGQPDDKTDGGYAASVMAAVENGLNVIDTAINYRFQRSERSIGSALKQLAQKGFSRDEFILCTKGGYLTSDGSMPSEPNEYFYREYIQPGVFKPNDIVQGSHCVTPRFLENQLGRSLRNLQRGIAPGFPRARPRRIHLSGVSRGRGQNSILRDGYLERLPPGSYRAGIHAARGIRATGPRHCR